MRIVVLARVLSTPGVQELSEDQIQAWASEADLCWRLMRVAGDAVRLGGVAVTC